MVVRMKKFTDIFDKNYLIRALTAFLTAMFALGMIFYISYHLADRFKADLKLINAEEKTVVRHIQSSAYLFRDEIVLYTSGRNTGCVTPAVSDGERVSINQRVADLYNYTSPEAEKRIAEIDKQIDLLEQSKIENLAVQNTSGLDSEIYQKIETIRRNSEEGRYGDALSLRADLLVSIKKKEILTGGVQNFEGQIDLLLAERAELTAKLGTCLESVVSPCAGYFYSEVDGYEGIFDVKKLDSLTYDDFVQLAEAEASPVNSSAAGKIARDFRWYIACPMTKADASYFEMGQYYKVAFPYNNTTLNMKLTSVIGEAGGDGAVAVFECRMLPEIFDYSRMQPVQICATDYTGFEIPVSALRVEKGMEGVYVLDEVTIRFRRVNIVYEYDGYYLCVGSVDAPVDVPSEEPEVAETLIDGSPKEEEYSWIRRNDIIITEGKDLYIGKVIG